jgi:hypothetical protein
MPARGARGLGLAAIVWAVACGGDQASGPDAGVADAARAECVADPTPTGSVADCPAACTGGCQDGVCTIDCTTEICPTPVTCPDGYACVVECEGVDACDTTDIQCPAEHACRVECIAGVDACGDVALHCGAASCTMECGEATCIGAALLCGAGPCTATCSAETRPSLECGPSCECTPCP